MQLELRYIYEVYKEGSFSKAAQNLYITQPALSIAIQKTEEAIGMPLFDRNRRPVRPTLAGKIYIEMIRGMEFLESDLEERLNDLKNLNIGKIKIGGTHYINSYILPEVLTAFSEKYPGVTLELSEQSSDLLIDMLEERELDVAFNCDPAVISRFDGRPAFRDNILLAVPAKNPINRNFTDSQLTAADIIARRHLAGECPTAELSEFKELEFILLTPRNNLYSRSMKLFEEAGFEPKIKAVLSQLVTLFHLANSGFGAAFISDRLVLHQTDGLFFYKLRSDQIMRQFYMLLPKRKYVSRATRAFEDFFTGHADGV